MHDGPLLLSDLEVPEQVHASDDVRKEKDRVGGKFREERADRDRDQNARAKDPGRHVVVVDKETQREQYMIKTRAEAGYLFKYLILTQIVVYLEAGAIPCLLDQLSVDLNMNVTQQGALGGIVYFALSAASPLCAHLLQHHNPQHVLGLSLVLNNIATLIFALIPAGYAFSANLIIIDRGLIGFTQAILCVYTPLWADEYAPAEKAAGWMSYLQGSVPAGVMLGYAVGTVSGWIVPDSAKWFQSWRWPFIVQFVLVLPIMTAVFFVPRKHLAIRCDGDKSPSSSNGSCSPGSGTTEPGTEENHSIETVETLITTQPVVQEADEDFFDKDDANSDLPSEVSTRQSRRSRNSLQRGGSRLSQRRASRSHVNDPSGFMGYLEEAMLMSSSTPMSWSAGVHRDDDDYLLTSATMYGSQRGFSRFNRSFVHNDAEMGPLSSHRSMLGSWRDVDSPEVRPSPELSMIVPLRNGRSLSPSNVRATPVGYGTMDNVSHRSPTTSIMDASMFEEDFMEGEKASFADAFRELRHIPIYYLIVLGLTAVYFVVTGVQYWSTIFMIKSLHASKYIVNSLFVIIAGSGPMLGVIFGGWIVDRYGGYVGVQQRSKALRICMILGALAFLTSAVVTFLNDIYAVAISLWFLLFTGGSILPACTGIFISVVPAHIRPVASSLSVMIFNLLGYALSPYLTGLVMQHILTHEDDPHHIFDACDEACGYRLGFRFCLFWSVISVIGIGGAFMCARRDAKAQREATLDALESIPCVAVEEEA